MTDPISTNPAKLPTPLPVGVERYFVAGNYRLIRRESDTRTLPPKVRACGQALHDHGVRVEMIAKVVDKPLWQFAARKGRLALRVELDEKRVVQARYIIEGEDGPKWKSIPSGDFYRVLPEIVARADNFRAVRSPRRARVTT